MLPGVQTSVPQRTCCFVDMLCIVVLHWFAMSLCNIRFHVRCPHHQCPARALMPLCDQLSVCSHLWPTSPRHRMETSAERQVLSHAATPGTSNQIRFHVKCILTLCILLYMIAWFHMISINFYHFCDSWLQKLSHKVKGGSGGMDSIQ